MGEAGRKEGLGNVAAIAKDLARHFCHERRDGDAILDIGDGKATGEELPDLMDQERELEAGAPAQGIPPP